MSKLQGGIFEAQTDNGAVAITTYIKSSDIKEIKFVAEKNKTTKYVAEMKIKATNMGTNKVSVVSFKPILSDSVVEQLKDPNCEIDYNMIRINGVGEKNGYCPYIIGFE